MQSLTRREMLNTIGTGMGAFGLASVFGQDDLLAAPAESANPLAPKSPHMAPKTKSIIHLFMHGGPSHVDTFDYKPALAKYQGQRPDALKNLSTERRTFNLFPSPFKFSKHGQSGLEISEAFKEVATCADDLCVIRSMQTDIPNHDPGIMMMCSGSNLTNRPSFGSWLLYGLGSENQNLPGFITLCPGRPAYVGPQLWSNSFLPGIYQGCHVNHRDPDPSKVMDHLKNLQLGNKAQREQLDLLKALNEQHLAKHQDEAALQTRIQSMEMAFRMQMEAHEAFDLATETQSTRDAYGKGHFNDGCILARRLVERGVRVVQLYYDSQENWDSHESTDHQGECCRRVDQPIAALLKDLKQRDLLKDTLVLWGGEFGRTPVNEGTGTGRDHNHYGFSVWLAGGGVKGGMAYGATDEFGFTAAENRMHVHDLHATMLRLMGLDHERLTYRYSGRDFRLTDVHGKVCQAIMA